ncbi:MAG: Tex-like N-terminal domain-containing protein, partial [Chloroflexota bacterium]
MPADPQHIAKIAPELTLRPAQVAATAALLAEGATVPFIARYRKEVTGSLDEVAITAIRDRLAQLTALDQRRQAIVTSLQERNLLTDNLHRRLAAAETLTALEDLYLPFRPKRRTRATVARERGLEPLAAILLHQDAAVDPAAVATRFDTPAGAAVAADLQVPDVDAALQGARDIIAEQVADDAACRERVRRLFWRQGVLRSDVRAGKETEGAKYRDYFQWTEPVARAPSHRVLAIFRGEAEAVLAVSIRPPEPDAIAILEQRFFCGTRGTSGTNRCAEQVRLAVRDGYKRLLSRSMETETRAEAKQRADGAAIRVFAQNLRRLLLAPPLGQQRVLAIDPGFRTGCKLVVLDAQGRLLHHDVIYPDQGQQRTRAAAETVRQLVETYQIEA